MSVKDHCPACEREFTEIRDFPAVSVRSVTPREPDAETLKQMTMAFDDKTFAKALLKAIEAAIKEPPVAQYLETLKQSAGRTLTRAQLTPPGEINHQSPNYRSLPYSDYTLALSMGLDTARDGSSADVVFVRTQYPSAFRLLRPISLEFDGLLMATRPIHQQATPAV